MYLCVGVMYLCVRGHVFVGWGSCICVLGVMYLCVGGLVFVCWESCIYVLGSCIFVFTQVHDPQHSNT
jgi:hypothetical protein